MDMDKAKKKINLLKRQIKKHNTLYYKKDAPEISDAEYDRLYAELKALETEFPGLSRKDSPTESVGSDISGNFPQQNIFRLCSVWTIHIPPKSWSSSINA
jgi:DNA ligase (NAD+)